MATGKRDAQMITYTAGTLRFRLFWVFGFESRIIHIPAFLDFHIVDDLFAAIPAPDPSRGLHSMYFSSRSFRIICMYTRRHLHD